MLAATVVAACSSGGGSAAGGTMTLKGGKGATGNGGDGGYFDVEGSTGAAVKVLASGGVNTDVSLPTQLPYLGTNPQDVTTDTTLEVGASGFYLTASSTTVTNATGTVTGIRVRKGVTLTIKPNWDLDGIAATYEVVRISLSDGLIVEGTVKITPIDLAAAGDGLGPSTASVDLTGGYWWTSGLGGLFIASTGKIDVSGASSTSGAGSDAGYFRAHCDAFNNAGVITTQGGSGSTSGGNAGDVQAYANEGYAVSTGSITADGGAGAAGAGGSAGAIDVESYYGYGYVVAKGLLSASGGSGATQGGAGGHVYLYSDWGGMVASGTFRSNGGDATSDGQGGNGDYVEFDAYGALRVAGSIDTHGGKGASSGNGGSGGNVDVDVYVNEAWGSNSDEPDSAGVFFGASVDTHGGDGASGGQGGYFYVWNDIGGDATVKGSPITLAGYARIDNSGGDGYTFGGNAGSNNYLSSWGAYDGNGTYYAGGVSNDASFVMRGGKGETGAGGSGAGLDMETESDIYPPYGYGVANTGSLDGRGGDGATYGGAGGDSYLYGKFFVENSGTIDASGGKGGTADGGSASGIYLYSDVSLTSSGALLCNGGGSDSGNAGGGGSIYISAANTATVSGAVSANGGASASGTGGNGGYVWIMSQDDLSKVRATPTAAQGAGTGSPVAGEVWIDGMQISGG